MENIVFSTFLWPFYVVTGCTFDAYEGRLTVFNILLFLNKLLKVTVYFCCRIFWASKKFEGNTDMSEPWYGTSFSVEKITSCQIQVSVGAV